MLRSPATIVIAFVVTAAVVPAAVVTARDPESIKSTSRSTLGNAKVKWKGQWMQTLISKIVAIVKCNSTLNGRESWEHRVQCHPAS